MIVSIDISENGLDETPSVAPDLPGDAYLITLPGLELTVSYVQMESIWRQLDGWFRE